MKDTLKQQTASVLIISATVAPADRGTAKRDVGFDAGSTAAEIQAPYQSSAAAGGAPVPSSVGVGVVSSARMAIDGRVRRANLARPTTVSKTDSRTHSRTDSDVGAHCIRQRVLPENHSARFARHDPLPGSELTSGNHSDDMAGEPLGLAYRCSLKKITSSRPFVWHGVPYIADRIGGHRPPVYLLRGLVDRRSVDAGPLRWCTDEMIIAGIESGAIRTLLNADDMASAL